MLDGFDSIYSFYNAEHYIVSIYKQSMQQFIALKQELGFQVSETQVFEAFN